MKPREWWLEKEHPDGGILITAIKPDDEFLHRYVHVREVLPDDADLHAKIAELEQMSGAYNRKTIHALKSKIARLEKENGQKESTIEHILAVQFEMSMAHDPLKSELLKLREALQIARDALEKLSNLEVVFGFSSGLVRGPKTSFETQINFAKEALSKISEVMGK